MSEQVEALELANKVDTKIVSYPPRYVYCEASNKDPSKCKDMLEGIEYCVIMTLTGTSYALLGHEVRHCFHGKFHD